MKEKHRWLIFFSILLIAALALSGPYTLYVGLVTLVLAALLLFALKPEFGLYLLVFSLPLINWNFDWNSLSASFVEIIALLLFLGFSLRQLYLFSCGELKRGSLKLPLWQPFLLFALVVITSALSSHYIVSSLWYAVRWLFFFYIVYLAVPYNIIKDGKILRNAIIALLLSGLGVAIIGLISLSYQDWYNEFFRVQPIAIGGIYPIGQNHNLIAEFLVIITFAVLSLKYWVTSARGQRLVDILFLFFLAVTVGTFSRTAWIVLGLEIVVFLALDTLYLKRKHWSSQNIIFALILSAIILVPFVNRMTKLQAENVSSTENRVLLTQIAWRAFAAQPILGHGPGTFVSLVDNNIRFRAKYGDPLDSHGLGQKLIAEVGFLGTATFALFTGLIFWNLYRALKLYKKEAQLLLPLAVAALGGLTYQFFNTSYYKGKLWVPIAIAVAAMGLLQKKYAAKKIKA